MQNLTNASNIEIDIEAFQHNLLEIKKIIGRNVKICPVLKSDGYGLGLGPFVQKAQKNMIHAFCVINNREISTIRGIDKHTPIIRISPGSKESVMEALEKNWAVEEMVGSKRRAIILSQLAQKFAPNKKIKVHINIDTAMGRMGLNDPHDLKEILLLPGLKIVGIMGHFAKAHKFNKEGQQLTAKQVHDFKNFLSGIYLPKGIIFHMANSSAIMAYPFTHMDMVRPGAALFGFPFRTTLPQNNFKPVLTTFKSKVVHINRHFPIDREIGYDSAYRSSHNSQTKLATIESGYNDGLPVNGYESGLEVLIRGLRFPIVGKVGMNLTTVDISKEDQSNLIQEGDEVVIIGSSGNDRITFDEVSRKTGISAIQLMLVIGKLNSLSRLGS